MGTQTYNYDEAISGDTDIEHTTVTIASGENLAKYTPISHDAKSGHFKGVAADTKAAQYLTAFAVDTSGASKKVSVIKAMTISPDFVAYPKDMTDKVKSGLFAGTPISVQEHNPI